jgi:hypothetical protein
MISPFGAICLLYGRLIFALVFFFLRGGVDYNGLTSSSSVRPAHYHLRDFRVSKKVINSPFQPLEVHSVLAIRMGRVGSLGEGRTCVLIEPSGADTAAAPWTCVGLGQTGPGSERVMGTRWTRLFSINYFGCGDAHVISSWRERMVKE